MTYTVKTLWQLNLRMLMHTRVVSEEGEAEEGAAGGREEVQWSDERKVQRELTKRDLAANRKEPDTRSY